MRSQGVSAAVVPSWFVGPPVATIAFMWLTRTSPVTAVELFYAFLLLLFPWVSFLLWWRHGRGGLPVFSMVGLTYWWWFVPGLFWLERALWAGRRVFYAESIDGAMLLALIGVVCMGIGMKIKAAPLPRSRQFELKNVPTCWFYVRSILVVGTLGSLIPGANGLLGAEGRQVMEILISTVPTVALLLLFRKGLIDPNAKFDRTLLWIYFPVRILAGLGSGWVGSVVSVGVICGVMYIMIRRRIPWAMIALSAAAVLFLQVGKRDFRQHYWYEGADEGIIEKANFWLNASVSKWSGALSSTGTSSSASLSSESLERTSLLPQVAHVLDVTPSQVPFQEGRTYSYMAVAWIPRFLWPDKPSVNDANRYYQLVFGLSSSKSVSRVNIGAGCLAESYINFGWAGVILIMFGIGVVLGIYERTFLSPDSSALFLAIGIALLPGILGIESQMSAYLGGVIQTVFLTLLVFLPVIRRRSTQLLNRGPKICVAQRIPQAWIRSVH